jgi:hypothetical protein
MPFSTLIITPFFADADDIADIITPLLIFRRH